MWGLPSCHATQGRDYLLDLAGFREGNVNRKSTIPVYLWSKCGLGMLHHSHRDCVDEEILTLKEEYIQEEEQLR